MVKAVPAGMAGPAVVPEAFYLSAIFSRGAAGFGNMVTRWSSPNSGAGDVEGGVAISAGQQLQVR